MSILVVCEDDAARRHLDEIVGPGPDAKLTERLRPG
jgi:hypothetical protein